MDTVVYSDFNCVVKLYFLWKSLCCESLGYNPDQFEMVREELVAILQKTQQTMENESRILEECIEKLT